MDQQERRLYWIWADMKGRCSNANHQQYRDYGARGVTVCARWQDFAAFKADMGLRPDGRSLDRIDNAKSYSPDNCRWATRIEQNSNRRSCILVECDGETVTLKEACRRKGLTYRPVVKRVQERGWPVELALSTPIGAPTNFLRRLSA